MCTPWRWSRRGKLSINVTADKEKKPVTGKKNLFSWKRACHVPYKAITKEKTEAQLRRRSSSLAKSMAIKTQVKQTEQLSKKRAHIHSPSSRLAMSMAIKAQFKQTEQQDTHAISRSMMPVAGPCSWHRNQRPRNQRPSA